MGEFFKPWRRKLACVTMLMACALMAGWVRSSFMFDGISMTSINSRYSVSSNQDKIRFFYGHADQARVKKQDYRFHSVRITRTDDSEDDLTDNHSGIVLGDIRITSGTEHWGHYSELVQTPGPPVLIHQIKVQLPYWIIVIPLTLISAFLLITHPRKSNNKKISDPTGIEGA